MSLMHIPDAVSVLERDLRGIFGNRLRSLVVYGSRARSAHGNNHAPAPDGDTNQYTCTPHGNAD